MKRIALFAFLLGIATGHGAISLGPAGTGTLTFDTGPTTNEWTTRSISGSAGYFFTEAALEAAVQTNTAGGIAAQLVVDASPIPTALTIGGWSLTWRAIFTCPAGVAAQMVMATVRNDSGSTLASIQIVYDLDTPRRDSFTPEEIPGHRVFFSLSGAAHSWQFVSALSGDTFGQREAVLNVGAWPPGALLYILWAQDNASPSPDTCYVIDNFFAGPEPPPPPCLLTHPTNLTTAEGLSATFSTTPCSTPPFRYQWFKDGVPIPGARGASYTIPRVHPADAGGYFVTLSNSTGTAQSTTATLAVIPDEDSPRATLACRFDDPSPERDILLVYFSERLEAASAGAVQNYDLRGISPASHPAILEATVTNESIVMLRVEKLTGSGPYVLGVSNVADQSEARHVVSPNPTYLVVQSFGAPLVPADYPWKYSEAPTNTTWPDWINPGFDDVTWLTGPGAFGLPFDEIVPAPFVLRTLFRTPDIGGTITTYFRTHFDRSATGTESLVQLSGVFDDGAVVYLNGTEVWRVRLPNGPVTPLTLASNAMEPHLLDGPVPAYGPGLLRAGANTLAVELHQISPYSGDAVMGLMLSVSEPMGCVPLLQIVHSDADRIQVSWSCGGTLQASSTPAGPSESWHDVVTATRSFTTTLSTNALFFRVRW